MKVIPPKLVDPSTTRLYSNTQGRVVGTNFFSKGQNVRLKVFVVDESKGNEELVFETASNREKLNSKEETVGAYLEVPATFQGNVLEPTPSKTQVMFRGKLRTVKAKDKPYAGQFLIASRKYPALNGLSISAPVEWVNKGCYSGWFPSHSKLEKDS